MPADGKEYSEMLFWIWHGLCTHTCRHRCVKERGGIWGSLEGTGVGKIKIHDRHVWDCQRINKSSSLKCSRLLGLSLQWFMWTVSKIFYSFISKYTFRKDVCVMLFDSYSTAVIALTNKPRHVLLSTFCHLSSGWNLWTTSFFVSLGFHRACWNHFRISC